ncbi:MAG: hypothetical protein E7547_05160 [Ruminococcaceae bacterium]|nr:hypothetical protein [Oscillospiraceae bacterium]
MRLVAKRHRPLVVINDKVITCHFGKIYLLDVESGKAEFICKLPVSNIKIVLSRFRFFERLLRIEARTAVALDDTHILLSMDGKTYCIDITNGKTECEYSYRNSMSNPRRMCRIEGIEGFDNCIAYGEYLLNSKRTKPSGIFVRSLDKADWKMVFEFPAGEIRHIHSLVPSKKSNCVYILTGDLDSESGIWEAKDNFETVTPIVKGSQMYRSGSLYETDEGFIYPTDTALEQNYIYYLEKDKTNNSLVSKVVTDMDGSCVSSVQTADKVLVSTTVEADESIRGWKSWINMKKGPGIKSDYAQLLSVDKATLKSKKIIQFKKDFLPYKLFQYGHIKIYDLPSKHAVLIYPIGVKKYDGNLLELKYGELE